MYFSLRWAESASLSVYFDNNLIQRVCECVCQLIEVNSLVISACHQNKLKILLILLWFRDMLLAVCVCVFVCTHVCVNLFAPCFQWLVVSVEPFLGLWSVCQHPLSLFLASVVAGGSHCPELTHSSKHTHTPHIQRVCVNCTAWPRRRYSA